MSESKESSGPAQTSDRITWSRRLMWHFTYVVSMVLFGTLYRYRAIGKPRWEKGRPVLLISNHQSFFDPLLIGMAIHPRISFSMARRSLWNHWLLAWIITRLNAIPVNRGEMDMAAMRRCLAVLKSGYPLVIYPEGTRTVDGTVGEFATGTLLLVRRAKPLVVPVAVEGAAAVWPKDQSKPNWCGRIRVAIGDPIEPADLLAKPAEEALADLRNQVIALKKSLEPDASQ